MRPAHSPLTLIGMHLANPLPIVCIGGAVVDRKHRLKGPLALASSNPASAVTGFGGVARNVAELLARLGAQVSLAAAVGDDAAGRDLIRHTAASGVEMSLTVAQPGVATAEYLAILAHDTGDLILGSAAMEQAEQAMDGRINAVLAALPRSCIIFADANLSPATLARVAAHATREECLLALDGVSVAKAPRLPANLAGVRLVVMNRDEAAASSGMKGGAATLAAALVRRGAACAIVTAGAEGATLADADGIRHAPASPVAAVDVTGAGDSLVAAILWRMSLGETPDQALPWGMAAAAAAISSPASVHPGMSAAFLAERVSRMPRP